MSRPPQGARGRTPVSLAKIRGKPSNGADEIDFDADPLEGVDMRDHVTCNSIHVRDHQQQEDPKCDAHHTQQGACSQILILIYPLSQGEGQP